MSSASWRTYSTGSYMHVPLIIKATGDIPRLNVSFATKYRPPIVRVIDGTLTGEKRLTHPLSVTVEYDDGEVVVSEPRFHIHASAPTEVEAIEAFRRIFAGYLDILLSQKESLGGRMREQLQYLQSYITDITG